MAPNLQLLVRAECVRCPSIIFVIIFLSFFSFFCATYFSPRRGCLRVMRVISSRARGAFMSTAQLLLNELSLPSPPQTRAPKKFRKCRWGLSGGSSVRRSVSKDQSVLFFKFPTPTGVLVPYVCIHL